MDMEAKVVALLGPLVGGRIHADVADVDTPRPYITWQQNGGVVVEFLDGAAPSMDNALLQIDVWGNSREQVNGIIREAAALLRADPDIIARAVTQLQAMSEPDLKLRGARQDFSIWWKPA
jgi:hypothetical protein